jgi:succinate dehydrogenase hydrophobic anchor subunit
MGMEVIAEDYIQNKFKQRSTIALLRFINLTTFAFLIFTIVIGFTMLNDTQIEMKQNSQNIQEEQKIN